MMIFGKLNLTNCHQPYHFDLKRFFWPQSNFFQILFSKLFANFVFGFANQVKHSIHAYQTNQYQNYASMIHVNLNQVVSHQSAHHYRLMCEGCGKNIFEKSANTFLLSTTNVAERTTTRQHTNSMSNSHLLTTVHHDLNDFNDDFSTTDEIKTYKFNLDNVQGCLNCKKFLPQCTICLSYMTLSIHQYHHHHQQQQQQTFNSRASIQIGMTHQSPKPTQPLTANLKISPSITNTFTNVAHIASCTNTSNANPEKYFFLLNNKFGHWFAWCQSCKHGGHVKHLYEWFDHHETCPFLHCNCKCLSIDNF
jgi:hypothetical protein